MLKFLAILLCLLIGQVGFCQESETDSLKGALEKTSEPNARVELLIRLSGLYWDSNNDSAKYFAEQALILSRESKDKNHEARSLIKLGNAYWSLENYVEAQKTFHEALNISEDLNNDELRAICLTNIGLVYTDMNDLEEAIANISKALQFYEKVIKNVENGKKINSYKNRITDLKRSKAYALGNIGDAYEKKKDYDSSLNYYNQAKVLAEELQETDLLGYVLFNLGGIYTIRNNAEFALAHYKVSLPYLLASDNKKYLSSANHGIAEIFFLKGKQASQDAKASRRYIDSAISYAKIALLYSREGNFKNEVYSADTILSKLYEWLKDTNTAFYYSKMAIEVKDSMQLEPQVRDIEKEHYAQKEIEKEREEKRLERSNNFQVMVVGICIAIFFGVLLILSKRKTKYRYLKYFGLFGLLILFEYLNILAHPFISDFTHHKAVYYLVVSVIIAAALAPFHHRLTNWVHANFTHKRRGRPKKSSSSIAHRKPVIKNPENKV